MLLDQGDCGLEGDEVAQFRHVDSIAVRIPDLRSSGSDDDFPGIGASQDAQDGPFQRGTADDGVVNGDEDVFRPYGSVRKVVYVGDELGAAFFLRDKGTHLDVLVRDFFTARPAFQDGAVQHFFIQRPVPEGFQ